MEPAINTASRRSLTRRNKMVIGLATFPAIIFGGLIALRLLGLLRPFSVPTGGMTPAVSPGDHVMMEGLTYLTRQPRRGEIVVFKSDGIPLLQPGELYIKRVAGEPGEEVRISEGKLFVNGRNITLTNAFGPIVYELPPTDALPATTELTIPQACYFLLGDDSTNSLDSRYWGAVPRQNIIGRICLCFSPSQRVGAVK